MGAPHRLDDPERDQRQGSESLEKKVFNLNVHCQIFLYTIIFLISGILTPDLRSSHADWSRICSAENAGVV